MHLAHCLYNAAPLGHAAPVAVEKCRPRTGCPLPMKILDLPLNAVTNNSKYQNRLVRGMHDEM